VEAKNTGLALREASKCGMLPVEPSREPLKGLNMARRRGTQKGRVHKQGKMWYVAYREDALNADGKLVRVRRNARICSTEGVSKRQAQRIADEQILNKVNLQSQQPSSMVTFKDYVESRFKPQFVQHKKHAGQLHYAYILDEHVIPILGSCRLRDVDNDVVQRLIDMKAEHLSPQTVRHIRNTVRKVFAHAKSRRAFVGELPTEGVELPEMVKTKEAHAMDFNQAMGFLAALKEVSAVAYAMVLLALVTSMNIAEMLGLRRRRVNLTEVPTMVDGRLVDGPSVSVRENCYRGVFGTVKAKSRVRDVPITMPVVEALQTVLTDSPSSGRDGLVFCTEKGTPLDEKNLMRRVIKPVAVKLGMQWMGWHVLRHTHATLSERIGMALVDRQAQMGHSDVRMTLNYTHVDMGRRRVGLTDLTDRLLGCSKGAGLETNTPIVALNDTKKSPSMAVSH
jgi:integrase